jgi:tetratricopeptide (TPR) repeat protein
MTYYRQQLKMLTASIQLVRPAQSKLVKGVVQASVVEPSLSLCCVPHASQLQKNGDINVGALLQQYFARGFAHERLMEPDMAMKDYGTCLRLDSRFSPALYNRALLHYDMCEYQQVGMRCDRL